MFCQREVTEAVIAAGGDDLFAVKGNQPGLQREIELDLTANSAALFLASHGLLRP